MTNQNPDRAIDRLLLRATVPVGLRPRTDEQIARLLDTIGGVPVDDEKLNRMLRKINRSEPVGPAPDRALPFSVPPLSKSEEELIALHRAQGKTLPADIAKRLRELERRTAESENDGGVCDER